MDLSDILLKYKVHKLSKTTKEEFFKQIKDCDEKTKELFEIIIKIADFSKKNDKLVLVNAGYAMDLAIGFISRNHNDLDLIGLEKDLNFFRKYFSGMSFKLRCADNHDENYSFTFEKDKLSGDVDSIKIVNEKVSDIEKKGEERWVWPIKTSELIWSRKIDNTIIYFVSPTLVYDFKKRIEKRGNIREKEKHDFRILEKYFPYLKDYLLL